MRYVLWGIGIIGLALLGVLLFFRSFAFAPTPTTLPSNTTLQTTVLAHSLSVPWDVVVLPDKSLLISERSGSLVRIYENGERGRIPFPRAHETGESGLLGMTLHPQFEKNNWLYVYHTAKASGGGLQNTVARYALKENTLTDETIIIENIPGALYHDGGRLSFGPDGLLYITTGDATNALSAQDTNSLAGKILRVHDDGSIPRDNPFENEVYSYGHRNPQGLTWDTRGALWSTEHGRSGLQSGLDELNRIEKGGNYGWPLVEGDETREGMIAPVIQSGPDVTWAPASLTYFNGKLYWGGLRGEALFEATLQNDTTTLTGAHFYREFGRIRTVTVIDDALLFTTSNTDGRGRKRAQDDKVVQVLFE